MNFLINASIVKSGGSVQVADSFIRMLSIFSAHKFIVVLSPQLASLEKEVETGNVTTYIYSIRFRLKTLLTGRDAFLDDIVNKNKIHAVFTVFGPSLWCPKVPHLCGFALAHIIYTKSIYYKMISRKERWIRYISDTLRIWNFKCSSHAFVTENIDVSCRLERIVHKPVYTVTNNYHQIFDMPDLWDTTLSLPDFGGTTLLNISVPYKHKNLQIIPFVIDYLENNYPNFNFRFVLTINDNELQCTDKQKEHILFLGRVTTAQCPHLYAQSDILFHPTVLECFSASFAEAMRMGVPIISADLPFAHGLCGEAALYASALSEKDIAEKIFFLANDETAKNIFIKKGKEQLQKFTSFRERATLYIDILVKLAK